MHCIDRAASVRAKVRAKVRASVWFYRCWPRLAGWTLWAGAVGCSSPTPAPPPPTPLPVVVAPAAPQPTSPVLAPQVTRPAPLSTEPTLNRAADVARPAPAASVRLSPARTAKSWTEFRTIAAQRLVAANPAVTYTGAVPNPLLAIPVLEIELNADGSVRRIDILRRPTQALDTIQLAIDAIHRAAPFGDVSRLPKPWKFNEVFLFDEQRRFKPRTLDL